MNWTSTERKRLWKNFIFSPGYFIVPFSNTTPQSLITVPLSRYKKMMTKFLKPALLPGSVHGTNWLYGSRKHLRHKDPFKFYFFNLSLVNPGNCTGECGVCEWVTLLTGVPEVLAEQLLSAGAPCPWRDNDGHSQALLHALHKSIFPKLFSTTFNEHQRRHTKKYIWNFKIKRT